jgi:TolB-like protein
MPDVFIAHASASKAEAQRLSRAVRALGYEVWWDDELPPHRAYSEVIEERLGASRAVLVVWSRAAVRSQWVRAEADYARVEGKLVQLVVDDAALPLPFNQIQYADLRKWKGETSHPEWRKVAASLAELVARDSPPAAARALPGRRPQRWIWPALSAAAALLIGLAAWAFRDRLPFTAKPSDIRVAVLPFDATGGGEELAAFSSGLLDETLGALNSDRVQALSRTDSLALRGPQAEQAFKRLGVGLFLDGTVQKTGDIIKVRVRLNDAHDHTTLWSADIERPTAEASALQAQVAARSADATNWALIGRRRGGEALDSATLADFVGASDGVTNQGEQPEARIRRVVAKAPNFADAHSRLALLMSPVPGQSHADLIAAKRREAERALELDPRSSEAYTLLSLFDPVGAWRQRDELLRKAVTVDPDFAPAFHFQSKFFAQVGRNQDALTAAQQGAAINPLFLGVNVDYCVRLTHQAHLADARAACERADRLWPNEYTDLHQFNLELQYGRERQALARLQKPDLRDSFGPADVEALTRFLRARVAGDAAAARAAALAAGKAADAGTVDRRTAYLMLVMAGQADAALAQADRFFTPQYAQGAPGQDPLDTSLLFLPAADAVRQDVRFMALANRLGLVDYWRTSGVWPDFCAEPGLPYECKSEAAKFSPKA